MSLILCCALFFPQTDNPVDAIRNPKLEVVELPELAIEGGKYPTITQVGEVLYVSYFAIKDNIARLEQRRLIDGKFTAPTLISASENLMVNWADTPRFAVGKDGSSIITWLESNGHGYGIKYMFSRESGAAYTDAKWLHQDQRGAEHGFVSLVALSDGGFFAAWLQGGDFGVDGVYQTSLIGLVINADGSLREEFVLDDKVCDCCDTDAEIFSSGNVVVTFRDRNDDEERDIYYVRGNPLEPKSFSAAKSLALDNWKPDGCPVNGPAIASFGRHTSALTYSDKKWSTPRLQIAQSKGGGKKFGIASILSAKDTIGRADIAYLPEGIPVAAWLHTIEDEVWWVAKAVPRKGMPGPRKKISKSSIARNSGFISLASTADGVIACYNQGDSLRFSSIKFKQVATDAAAVETEK
jgi:hypothetical protein